jgi:uncharacterized protein
MKGSNLTAPTKENSRIEILDIWRGFAIFGILMVNMLVFNCSFPYRSAYEQEWSSTVNQFTLRFLEIFFYSNFYPIFSFLFGLGISLQVLKQVERNTFRLSFFVRRFLGLFLLGVFHIVFIWSGDILHLYALLGIPLILLLLLARYSNLVLWISMAFVFLFPYWSDLIIGIENLSPFNLGLTLDQHPRETLNGIYHKGSYLELVAIRLKEYRFAANMLYGFMAPVAFSMMLLGAYVVKSDRLKSIPQWVKKHQTKLGILALIAFGYNAFIIYYMLPTYGRDINPYLGYVLTRLYFLSHMFKGLFYLFLLAWLYEYTIFKKPLSYLQSVGRMALSNYLLQSILALFIFSNLGLGWYEHLSPFQCILMVFVIYSIEIIISPIWFRYFRYGWFEWLWRSFSYGRILKNRK